MERPTFLGVVCSLVVSIAVRKKIIARGLTFIDDVLVGRSLFNARVRILYIHSSLYFINLLLLVFTKIIVFHYLLLFVNLTKSSILSLMNCEV